MKRSKTHEQFCKEVYGLVGNEYTILGEYINSKTKVLMKHNVEGCGLEHYYNVGNFLCVGSRCPKCSEIKRALKRMKTQEQFEKEVYEVWGNEYSVIGKYKGTDNVVLIRHNICGHEWSVFPNNLTRGHECPKCVGKRMSEYFRKSYIEVKEYIESFEGYKLLSKNYINAHEDLEIMCPKKHIYNANYLNFYYGQRCPVCNISKGEERIKYFLLINNISFKPQYKIKECRGKKFALPFDFAILDNNNLKFLIEYQGIQHYKPVERFGGLKSFEEVTFNDNIKTTYCQQNNIPLLRIPYWEFDNIESILTDYLTN